MEKTQLLEVAGSAPAPRRRTLSPYIAALLVLSALVKLAQLLSPRGAHDELADDGVHGPKIGKLIPTKCWSSSIKPPYECYYLHAPLDHLNETDSRTARLAVVTYPAGGGKTAKEDVLGTMLLNPGGPGGSGISFLSSTGARFNYTSTGAAIDKMMKGRYHLLSWDPRAVGYSTPAANCLRWPTQGSDCGSGLPKSSSSAATCNLQETRLTAQLCTSNATLADELRFVSTPSTARDMRLLYQAAGDKVLHYWGFSYGTALGSTFADMFPNEVGRVALDGTVDVPNYAAGYWDDNLLNTDGTYEKGLLGECTKAGDKCALNKAAKGQDLKAVLDKFYQQLIDEPLISLVTNTTFLTYSAFKGQIFQDLYSSYGWPKVTSAMAAALEGNATAFIQAYLEPSNATDPTPQSFDAIAGGDALVRREDSWTLADYEETIVELEKQSNFAGEIWATDKSVVQTWPIVAKERHFGNYTSQTRHPILYIGNDYDPVTPLLYARKMATLFPGAAVLRVKAYGHCSTAQPSKCAAKTISNYFLHGTLPERTLDADGLVAPGKVCDVDRQPWDDAQAVDTDDDGLSQHEGMVIMDALQSAWSRPGRL